MFFDDNHMINQIVEKPAIDEAPSQWAVVARYILNTEIFSILEHTRIGVGNELQLTDAIFTLLSSQGVYAHCFQGKRFDCGSPLGYIQAIIDSAMQQEEFSSTLARYFANEFESTLV